MNNGAYTAYPEENELMLREGVTIYVMEVERDVKLENPYPNFQLYNGQTITIIHFFNH